jgi:glycosyltransferase involved in cell wall biosynthesis
VTASIRLSIVLPCYNEAETLPELLRGYAAVWQALPAELILVDNGSTDATAATLAAELADPELGFARVVTVPVNQGYGHGIATGLAAARGEFVAISHADLQCAPADVFRAYHALLERGDPTRALVKGRRSWRGLGAEVVTSGMTVLASTVLLTPLADINAQPKVFHRGLLAHLGGAPSGFELDLYVLHQARRAGFTIATIPVEFPPRRHGASKWSATLRSRWRTIARVAGYVFRLRAGADR